MAMAQQDGKAEKLHQFIGDDGTRIAEKIAGRGIDGVVERRIGDRPGRECQRHGDDHCEEDERGELIEPVAQEAAQRRRELRRRRSLSDDHRPSNSPASPAEMRWFGGLTNG